MTDEDITCDAVQRRFAKAVSALFVGSIPLAVIFALAVLWAYAANN